MKAKRVLKWSATTIGVVLLVCAGLIGLAYWRTGRVPAWYAQARNASPHEADENHIILIRNWLARASSGNVDAKPADEKRLAVSFSAADVNELIAKWTGNLESSVQDIRIKIAAESVEVAGQVKAQNDRVVTVELRPAATGTEGLQITLGSIKLGEQTVPSVMIPDDARQRAIATMSRAAPNDVTIDQHSRASRQASAVYGAVSMVELLQGHPIKPYAFIELTPEKEIVVARVRAMKLADGRADMTLELLGPEEREALVNRLRAAVTQPAPQAAAQP